MGWPGQNDPELHDLCARKLLIPGRAGEVTDGEAAYIARELTLSWVSPRFERQLGMRPSKSNYSATC